MIKVAKKKETKENAGYHNLFKSPKAIYLRAINHFQNNRF